MANEDDDLWPSDLGEPPEETLPVVILREQAAALGKRMFNVLEAEVYTTIDEDPPVRLRHTIKPGYQGDVVTHRFLLKAPTLGDYRYLLFRAYHAVAQSYPLGIEHDGEHKQVKSEDEFRALLRTVFSAESTRKVISSLKAHSRG